MVSVCNRHLLTPIIEGNAGRSQMISSWKLDSSSLKFIFKIGQNNTLITYDKVLPFKGEFLKPQNHLLQYVIAQPYSREMVCSMLGLQKFRKDAAQHCQPLEEEIVNVLVSAMKYAEMLGEKNHIDCITSSDLEQLWRNLTSQLIFFVLFQFVSFPRIITQLHMKLMSQKLRKGRDELMWVLLQFISGSIAKNETSDFIPVLKLYDLYTEKEAFPIPNISLSCCTKKMAAAGIFIHLTKRAHTDNMTLQIPLPIALQEHHTYLQNLAVSKDQLMMNNDDSDFRVALLCNTFSTNQDYFHIPMEVLVDAIGASSKPNTRQVQLPGGVVASGPVTPLSMDLLDSLSVHSKMSLIHSILTHIKQLISQKSTIDKPIPAMAPSIVETYGRLLVYMEIESLGIKGFLTNLLQNIFSKQAWGTLHTLLEMFSYRLHHIQAHYRVHILTNLLQLARTHTLLNGHPQLYLCVESTALRLTTGLANAEVQPPKNMETRGKPSNPTIYGDSEELNRVLVLTIARAIHIAGVEAPTIVWIKEVLGNIMQTTPHTWPAHVMQCFPPLIKEFFEENKDKMPPVEAKEQLNKAVEEEYKNWTTMTSDNDIINHFSLPSGSPLFLCVIWKMLLEKEEVRDIAFKVLERIGAKQLSTHIRSFCDFMVYIFNNSGGGGHVNKCIDAINSMIWKYHIITLDRLILTMALRNHEGNEAQVCLFIIQLLLLKPLEFRNRLNEFVTASPNHWCQNDWHKTHLNFHNKFPEKFAPDEITSQQPHYQILPTYFGNVCLRILPVFDIIVHRFLEVCAVTKSLHTLFDHLGCLYKFHDKPITYLYNTLFYYEKRLRDKPLIKRKLTSGIIGALKDIRPSGWCLSESYLEYTRSADDPIWSPELEYYFKLVGRLVLTIQNKLNNNGTPAFPSMDWRFNEFPNAGTHATHVTCVELMALPVMPETVGRMLTDVIVKGYTVINAKDIPHWANALGIIFSNLPESYSVGFIKQVATALDSDIMKNWPTHSSPFSIFNSDIVYCTKSNSQYALCNLIMVGHSIWHHAGFSQLTTLPQIVKDNFSSIVRNEEQLLFICHLIGPSLQRLHIERQMRTLFEITKQLYEMLAKVDQTCTTMKYIDPICDLLYHIKYQFTGDLVKDVVEKIIKNMRLSLQMRLRFIASAKDEKS